MPKEFKKLVRENMKIREKIDNLIGLEYPLYSPLWVLINELIDNEIKQESFCNE